MSEDEINMPGEEWPSLMYMYKPGIILTEFKKPKEIIVDDLASKSFVNGMSVLFAKRKCQKSEKKR